MQLFSATLTPEWLKAMADPLGIQLWEFEELDPHVRGPQRGKRRFKFLLRPISGHPEGERRRKVSDNPWGTRPRRNWAVSWDGHYEYMERIFRADQDAQLRTTLATYDGMHGFRRDAPATGDRNVGSRMYPLAYRDAHVGLCDDGDPAFANVR